MSWHIRPDGKVYWLPAGTSTYDPLYDGPIPLLYRRVVERNPEHEVSFTPNTDPNGIEPRLQTAEGYPPGVYQVPPPSLTTSHRVNRRAEAMPRVDFSQTDWMALSSSSNPLSFTFSDKPDEPRIPAGRGGRTDPDDPNAAGCQR